MKGGSILHRLRQLSISSSLRGAFLTGALLTLSVSCVSLYSWHEQSSQIRYSLDDYFPRVHSAFLIEGISTWLWTSLMNSCWLPIRR